MKAKKTLETRRRTTHFGRRATDLSLILSFLFALPAAGQLPSAPPKITWTGCGITKLALMEQLASAYLKKTGIEVVVSGGGATRGIRSVATGESQIGGSCRHPLDVPEEQETRVVPIAWDALTVVTHPDNPVEGLSADEVRQIFLGGIRSWAKLGAPELGDIHVYVRDGRLSGVGYMSRIMFFSDATVDYFTTHRFPSTGPLETALEKDPRGIAFTGISSAKKRDLKVLAIDGVLPSFESILDGSYGFVRPLFLTYLEGTEDPMVLDFIAWTRSEEGQAAILGSHVVPISMISSETWDRYYAHMRKASQDTEALERIVAALLDEG